MNRRQMLTLLPAFALAGTSLDLAAAACSQLG